MTELLLVMLLGLAGPLLAAPKRFALPVAVGELLAGVLFGASGLHIIDAKQPNLALLGQIGFALVMMVTASHINVQRLFASKYTLRALVNVCLTAATALLISYFIAWQFGSMSHLGVFAVVLASSSAAVVLPVFAKDGEAQKSKSLKIFVSQVAIADLACVVLLPLLSNDGHSAVVAIGAALVTGASLVVFGVLRFASRSGLWKRMRDFSAENGFGLELRISLILLLILVLVAQNFTVTIMVAGFGLGLAIAANGMPRRLAKQLFAVSEGLFSPIFFVLLGAGINVGSVFSQPRLLGLALLLGFGALAAHLTAGFTGLKWRLAVASSAQLGVPAAAVSIGFATHTLTAGEGGAVMLGALITLAATAIAAAAKTKPKRTKPAKAKPAKAKR